MRAPAAAYGADCLSVFYLADALHDDAYGSLACMMRALWLCDTSPTPPFISVCCHCTSDAPTHPHACVHDTLMPSHTAGPDPSPGPHPGPAAGAESVTEEELLRRLVSAQLRAGESVSAVSRALAQQHGLPRGRIYRLAMLLESQLRSGAAKSGGGGGGDLTAGDDAASRVTQAAEKQQQQ